MNPALRACLLAAALMTATPPALADALTDSLDTAMRTHDNRTLVAIIRAHPDPAGRATVMGWMTARIHSGAGAHSEAILASSLARANGQVEDALMYLDYALATSLIDAAACPDPTSTGGEGMIFLLSGALKRMPVTIPQRRDARDRAMALEAETSGRRSVDAALCGGGMSAYAAAGGVAWPAPKPLPEGPLSRVPGWPARRIAALPDIRSLLDRIGIPPPGATPPGAPRPATAP